MIPKIATVLSPFIRSLNWLTPIGDLIVRLWVAQIFFASGLVKIQAWQSTQMLFAHVYRVPLLAPNLAAILGTGAELILPILLVIGLGGRFVILLFFLYNAICAISYPFLWTAAGSAGLSQHMNWGLLLMMFMFHGSGKISLDYWLHQRHGHHLIPNRRR